MHLEVKRVVHVIFRVNIKTYAFPVAPLGYGFFVFRPMESKKLDFKGFLDEFLADAGVLHDGLEAEIVRDVQRFPFLIDIDLEKVVWFIVIVQ